MRLPCGGRVGWRRKGSTVPGLEVVTVAGLEVGAEDSAPPPPPPLVSFVGGAPPSTVCGRTTPVASCDCV